MSLIIYYKAGVLVWVVYIIRVVSVIVGIYALITIRINPLFLSIVFLLCIVIFFLSTVSRIILYEDHICFKDERVLSFLNKCKKIYYDEIGDLDFNKIEISYITHILPGIGYMKDAELIFRMKDGRIIKEDVLMGQKKLKEITEKIRAKMKI